MTKEKTYRYDDAFKAKARAHQFAFRENELHITCDEKNPRVMLPAEAASRGLIFCDTYRELIREYTRKKTFGTSHLFADMLRSEHIPYNMFVPMEQDREHAAMLFNELTGGGIAHITKTRIEYAGKHDRSHYLKDGTSFDAFIEYIATDGRRGALGIEVKYTEKGYNIGKDEKEKIEEKGGEYQTETLKSGYFKEGMDINMFINADHLRQIWRNHILGYSMTEKGDFEIFHHIHLYPEENTHFHCHAVPEYRTLLTEKGYASFIPVTYEQIIALMEKYFRTERQTEWISYLKRRYLVE